MGTPEPFLSRESRSQKGRHFTPIINLEGGSQHDTYFPPLYECCHRMCVLHELFTSGRNHSSSSVVLHLVLEKSFCSRDPPPTP